MIAFQLRIASKRERARWEKTIGASLSLFFCPPLMVSDRSCHIH